MAVGKLDVERGDAAGVMGGQHHFHRLVDVAPFGVVVVLFRHQRRAGHEPEGFVEILEDKGAANRLAARASRVHPGKPFRADFRASADSRSAMMASLYLTGSFTLTPKGRSGSSGR